MSAQENNKRIAKNTMILYIRMFAVMAVSLFTSRVVLDVLGSQDYGINNVVGGIVTMLSFMSSTMTHSAQRFFSIELGRKNYTRLNKLFQINLTIYCCIGIVVIVLGETLGLWFLHNYMTIPSDRMLAADWVLHFAIFTFCLSMLVLPFKAAIMARENMSIMAYLSIIEVVARLGLVYLLTIFDIDKLILFSVLNFIVHIVINGFYITLACKKYEECRIKLAYDKVILRNVLGFTGWSIMGHFAMIMRSQGINIILNIFCGPVVNAARAIAFQVNSAVSQFYTNFFMAVKPQIIKYYSVDDRENMFRLVIRSSKLCYFLVFVLALPILLETEFILNIWLKKVPEFTSEFVQLVILNTLVEALMPGLSTSIDATGKVKRYEIWVTSILLLNIPVSWWLLKAGFNPYIPFYAIIVLSIGRLILQFFIVRELITFRISLIIKEMILPVIFGTLSSIVLPFVLLYAMPKGWISFFLVSSVAVLSTCFAFFYIGMNKLEQIFVVNTIKNRFAKNSR